MSHSKNGKYWLAACLLAGTMIVTFPFPKLKYTGTDVLSLIHIPEETNSWQSRDLSEELDLKDTRYNFINRAFMRQYANEADQRLVFFVLDAGNFHHPQVCFGNSGYEVKPMDDLEMDAAGRHLKGHALFMKKKEGSFLVVYWICVDKKETDWTGQKLRRFFSSLVNKKKTGLMGRLDIPTVEEHLPQSIQLAKRFVHDISEPMTSEDADYLFGAS